MATFRETYPSEHSPEDLWRAINTPILDPNLVGLIYEGVDVRYQGLSREGLIKPGSSIKYIPQDALIEKAPPMFRNFIPKDIDFYVSAITTGYGSRHDILRSRKADGGIFRTVEGDGDGSLLLVEATLNLDGVGSMFDRQIENALEATVGSSSDATVELVPEILGVD